MLATTVATTITSTDTLYLLAIRSGQFRPRRGVPLEENPTLARLEACQVIAIDRVLQTVTLTVAGLKLLADEPVEATCCRCQGQKYVRLRGEVRRCSGCGGTGKDRFVG